MNNRKSALEKFINGVNLNYPKFIKSIQYLSTMIISLAMGLTTIGTVAALIGVAYVENHRLYEAIFNSITRDITTAQTAAMVVVLLLVLIPIVEVNEKLNKGTLKLDSKVNPDIEKKFTLRHFWYSIRNFLGLWEEKVNDDGIVVRQALPIEYRYKSAPSPTKNITNLKYALVFTVIVLAFISSSSKIIENYAGLPFSEGFVQLINFSDMKQLSDILVNVLFTSIIALAEITLASFAAELSARAYREVEDVKDRVEKEQELVSGVYFIGDITDDISRALVVLKSNPKIKAEDKVKIDEDGFDFFDSEKDIWVSGGKGYGNVSYLKKKIDVVLEGRK